MNLLKKLDSIFLPKMQVIPINDGMCQHSSSFCILKKDMNYCMKNQCNYYRHEN